MVKRRKGFSDLGALAKALELVERKSPFGTPDKLDGLKWSLDSSWVQVRASNTEPIIRVFAEANDAKIADELTMKILDLLDAVS
jgi:phosphomannomutase